MRRDSGEEPQISGTIRLMQRPLSMQCSKVEGGGELQSLSVARRKKRHGRGRKKGPLSLFIRQMDKR